MKRRSFLGAALATPMLGFLAKADSPAILEDPIKITGWGFPQEEVVPFHVATFKPIVFKELGSEVEYITKDGVKLIFRLPEPLYEWPMDPDTDPQIHIDEWRHAGTFHSLSTGEDYQAWNVKRDVSLRLRCQTRDKGKYFSENLMISENVHYDFFEIRYETPVNKNNTSYVYRTLWHRVYDRPKIQTKSDIFISKEAMIDIQNWGNCNET
jgi:hypothetical protein